MRGARPRRRRCGRTCARDVRVITFAWPRSSGDDRSSTSPRSPTGRRRAGAVGRADRRRPARGGRGGGRARRRSSSASRRPTTSPTRSPAIGAAHALGDPARGAGRGSPQRSRSRACAGRSSSFRAAFSSSTTATTRTPCRCVPPSITSPQVADARGAPAHGRGARRHARARARRPSLPREIGRAGAAGAAWTCWWRWASWRAPTRAGYGGAGEVRRAADAERRRPTLVRGPDRATGDVVLVKGSRAVGLERVARRSTGTCAER